MLGSYRKPFEHRLPMQEVQTLYGEVQRRTSLSICNYTMYQFPAGTISNAFFAVPNNLYFSFFFLYGIDNENPRRSPSGSSGIPTGCTKKIPAKQHISNQYLQNLDL